MPPIRVYERATVPHANGPLRFADIDQASDLLRPGSIVCLVNSTADDMLVVEKDGNSTWRLALRRTGWSAREFHGVSTYAHDYLVESMAVDGLWLVIRNGGSIGFSSLAAGGRMLQAAESLVSGHSLSSRTPASWGATEAWERQRTDSGSLLLVSARWKHTPLGFTPLHCTCLPTAELTRAEAFWGTQLFAAKEQAKQKADAARESVAYNAELLKASERKIAILMQRVSMLESNAAQQADAGRQEPTSEVHQSRSDADATHLEAWKQEQDAQNALMQQRHAAEMAELQGRLAKAEEELLAMAADRDAAIAAAAVAAEAEVQAQLLAKDAENRRLLHDRHRLDVALFTIKNMAVAAKECSPSAEGESHGEERLAPAQMRGEGLPTEHGLLTGAAAAVAQQSAEFEIPAARTAWASGKRFEQALTCSAAMQTSTTLQWLEQQADLPMPPDPEIHHSLDEEQLIISFRRDDQPELPATVESESEADVTEMAEPGGCRVVKYSSSHRMDESALNRILDQPMEPVQHQARVYKSLASCPASPATGTDASPGGKILGWSAGSLSLPSSCVKVLEPSVAVQDMGRSSPGAADALAELFADQLVVRASLQQLPAKAGNALAAARLRRSTPAPPLSVSKSQNQKPRSSFLQRSALPDVFSIE